MRRFNKRISLLLLISLLLGSLITAVSTVAGSRAAVNANQADDEDQEKGLRFRLSQALDQPEAQPTSRLVPTTVLSDVETANILKRLAPVKALAPDEQEFTLREGSLPPPRTGQMISVS